MNAIYQATPSSLGKNLTIKSKFKNTLSGATKKWWFVIRGNKWEIDLLIVIMAGVAMNPDKVAAMNSNRS